MLNVSKIIILVQLMITSNVFAIETVKRLVPESREGIARARLRNDRLDGVMKLARKGGNRDNALALDDVKAFLDYYGTKDPKKYFADEMEYLFRRSEGVEATENTIAYFKARIGKLERLSGFGFLRGAVATYESGILKNPALKEVLPEALVLGQLAEAQEWWSSRRLIEIIGKANSFAAGIEPNVAVNELKAFIEIKLVEAGVLKADAETRFEQYERAGADDKIKAFDRLLGQLTFAEVKNAWYGADPLNPSPESVLGRFISETGTKTMVHQFQVYHKASDGYEDKNTKSPKRLVVPISLATFERFKADFLSRIDWTTIPRHGAMLTQGMVHGYAHSGPFEMNNPAKGIRGASEGTVIPAALLETKEGERLQMYLHFVGEETGKHGDYRRNRYMKPHSLMQGGYGLKREEAMKCDPNCTEFVGNPPIGSERSTTFSRAVYDQYRGQAPAFFTGEIMPHSDDATAGLVFSAPGRKTFSEVIGLGHTNNMGGFQSTGGAQLALAGKASQERVPVVFVVVNDHKADLNPANIKSWNEEPR